MNIQELVKGLSDRIQTTASVRMVYGDPVVAEGKTIIPVAKARYGFGLGGGSRGANSDAREGEEPLEAGGGGGGGVEVKPVGIIEITAGETRFISFDERRNIIKALLVGFLIGMFLWRMRRRS